MSTGSNDPETPKAAPERSKTTITVAGSDFELAGLSVEKGLEIYGKLPADYQKIADAYGILAQRFQRTLDVDVPGGISLETAIANTKAYYEQHGSMDGAEEYQKKIYSQVSEFSTVFDKLPVVGSAIGGAKATANAVGATGAFLKGGFDGAMLIPRILGAAVTTAGEGKDALASAIAPISDDQAKAFGAAMAGATLYESAVRKDMGAGGKIINYPGASIGAASEWATLNIPGLNAIWPYVQACWQMVSQWMSVKPGEPSKDFSEFVEENKKSAEVIRAESKDTYGELFERRVRGDETSNAMDKMIEAGEVAGVKTQDVMGAAKNGTPFIDTEGDATAMIPDNGNGNGPTENTNVDLGPNKTRKSRIQEAWYEPVKPIIDGANSELSAHPVAYGLGAFAVGGPAAWGTIEGAVRGGINQKLGRALKAEASAAEEVTKLQARRAKALEGKGRGITRSVESVTALDTKIEAATEKWMKAQSTLEDMGIDTDKVKELKGGERTAALRAQRLDEISGKGYFSDKLAKVADMGNKPAEGFWRKWNVPLRAGHAMGDLTARTVEFTVAKPTATFAGEVGAGYDWYKNTTFKEMGSNVVGGVKKAGVDVFGKDIQAGRSTIAWFKEGGLRTVPGNLYRGLGIESAVNFLHSNRVAADPLDAKTPKPVVEAAEPAKPATPPAPETVKASAAKPAAAPTTGNILPTTPNTGGSPATASLANSELAKPVANDVGHATPLAQGNAALKVQPALAEVPPAKPFVPNTKFNGALPVAANDVASGSSRLPGGLGKLAKGFFAALAPLGLAHGTYGVATHGADVARNLSQGRKLDASADAINATTSLAVAGTSGATIATWFGIGGSGVATAASIPVAVTVGGVTVAGTQVSGEIRNLAREGRAASVTGDDATKLIAMVKPGVTYDDPTLDFIAKLLKERKQRVDGGKSLDVTLMIRKDSNGGHKLEGISDKMSMRDIGSANGASSADGVMLMFYTNANIDQKLVEKSKFYLGNYTLTQAAATVEHDEAVGKLGFIDRMKYSVGRLDLPEPKISKPAASGQPNAPFQGEAGKAHLRAEIAAIVGAQNVSATLKGLPHILIREMDGNGDGHITKEELTKAQATEKARAAKDGVLGAVDKGLASAAIDAQKAAKPMLAHSVKLGAVKADTSGEPKAMPLLGRLGIDIPGVDFI